jgi:hypothetical protein
MTIKAIVLGFLLSVTGLLYSQIDLESGLVVYYTFEDIVGDSVQDVSGSGLNGGLVGEVQLTDGYTGNALEFNGIDTYIELVNSPALELYDQITISVWVFQYDAGNSDDNPWVIKGDNIGIKHKNNNSIEFYCHGDDEQWYVCQMPCDDSYNYDWHHMVGTYDGADLMLYVDGVFITSTQFGGFILETELPFNIARNPANPTRFYEGVIDEVRIYGIALTADEVTELYFYTSNIIENKFNIRGFTLNQNYPNPFNPATRISYSIPQSDFVTLKVFDIRGREMRTLVNQIQAAGSHSIRFDASALTSGVYLYQLSVGNKRVETRKMMLSR